MKQWRKLADGEGFIEGKEYRCKGESLGPCLHVSGNRGRFYFGWYTIAQVQSVLDTVPVKEKALVSDDPFGDPADDLGCGA